MEINVLSLRSSKTLKKHFLVSLSIPLNTHKPSIFLPQ